MEQTYESITGCKNYNSNGKALKKQPKSESSRSSSSENIDSSALNRKKPEQSTNLSSRSSSSSSSVLELLTHQPHSVQIDPPSTSLPNFQLSSPIQSKKIFSQPENKEKTFGFVINTEDDEDILQDLKAFEEGKQNSMDYSESSSGNLELDQAIVIDSDESDSISSEDVNGKILDDIQEECESPDKIDAEEIAKQLCDSSAKLHQAVSYLPTEFLQEKIKESEKENKNENAEKQGLSEEGKGKELSGKSEEKKINGKNEEGEGKELSGKNEERKMSEEKGLSGKRSENEKIVNENKLADTETQGTKKMISNSLLEEKKEKKADKDSKGSSVCSNCVML